MNGTEKFKGHLQRLEELLAKSRAEDNQGLWLYRNNARTTVFMLEALCKLYENFIGAPFDKLKDKFKNLEDAIGELDYFEALRDTLVVKPAAEKSVMSYVSAKSAEACERLNALLKKDKWLNKNKRIRKTRDKLDQVKWCSEKDELILTKKFYQDSIREINDFYRSVGPSFSLVEEHVHELRRKIRWLSIYPHALAGSIQLNEVMDDEIMNRYVTPPILASRYNTFPEPGNAKFIFELNKVYFLALSRAIDELGKLKDEGLEASTVADAYGSETEAKKLTTERILKLASSFMADFFNDEILEKLSGEIVARNETALS